MIRGGQGVGTGNTGGGHGVHIGVAIGRVPERWYRLAGAVDRGGEGNRGGKF